MDSTGIQPSPKLLAASKKGEVFGELSEESLQLLIDNLGSWNSMFDRSCEAKIEEELSKMPVLFEDFKKGIFTLTIADNVRLTDYSVEEKRKQMMGGIGGMFERMLG